MISCSDRELKFTEGSLGRGVVVMSSILKTVHFGLNGSLGTRLGMSLVITVVFCTIEHEPSSITVQKTNVGLQLDSRVIGCIFVLPILIGVATGPADLR